MTYKEVRDLCNRLNYCSKMLERVATVETTETINSDHFREFYETSEIIDEAICLIHSLIDNVTVA